MTPDFLLVADASPEIGMGHAVRMMALAQALVDAGQRVVFGTRTPEYIAERIQLPCQILGSSRVVLSARTVVADVGELGAVRLRCEHFVLVDDYGKATADHVVNMHFGAEAHDYGAPTFAGPQWSCLRSEFGSSLRSCYDWKAPVRVVFVRAEYPQDVRDALTKRNLVRARANTFYNAAIGLGSDIAVVSASMTAYECFALGLPTLVYAPTERHQPIADAMVKAGVALHWSEDNLQRVIEDAELRRSLSHTAQSLVDGNGAARLAAQLIRLR